MVLQGYAVTDVCRQPVMVATLLCEMMTVPVPPKEPPSPSQDTEPFSISVPLQARPPERVSGPLIDAVADAGTVCMPLLNCVLPGQLICRPLPSV